MTADVEGHHLPSFGSYVRGKDVESGNWVYALSARAVLDDSFASLTLKRNLEAGRVPLSEALPDVVVGRVAVTEKETAEDALVAGAEAAAVWRSAPLSVRFDGWMELLRDTIRQNEDEIIRMLTLEGHPLALARWELSGMYEMTRAETKEYLRGQMWQEFSVDGRRNIVRRAADGLVCINPPANAPLVSALLGMTGVAGGNAVVVRTPRTAPFGVTYVLRTMIAPILDELGAPPGTLAVVCGHPGPMLNAWISSPHVDDIMYFGDVRSGLKVERRCVEAGKKPILELAGNDIVLVWEDADLDRAADAIVEGFYGSGQLCMVPNQAVVHPAVADELIARVVARAEALRPGYPGEDGVLLSPVLRHDKFNSCLAEAVENGATVVTGGHGMRIDGTPDSAGFFIAPTVIRVDGLRDARKVNAVEHETFFPLMSVIVPDPTDDDMLFDSFIEFVNTSLYGLRNSLWARDPDVVDRFVTEVVSGGLLKVNDSHIAFTTPLPSHGGTGLTGGAFGEANYPVLRTTHVQGVSIISDDGPRPERSPVAPVQTSRSSQEEQGNANTR